MKKRDYSDYIQDIFNSITETRKFIEGMKFEDFAKVYKLHLEKEKKCRQLNLVLMAGEVSLH